MDVKKYRPVSGSLRGKQRARLAVSNNKKFRILCYYYKRARGRDITGQITTWHRGGGVRRLYRQVDYWRRSIRKTGVVQWVEYSPFTTANIALISYEDGTKQYILAAEGLGRGALIDNGERIVRRANVGSATILKNISPGTFVYNLEISPGQGGQMIRAGGTYGKVLRGATKNYIRIRLPSGVIRYFHKFCAASIGRVSNTWHKVDKLGGAGIRRRLGWRPVVRGTAKNAVDHPHGGQSGPSRSSRTPWGKPTK